MQRHDIHEVTVLIPRSKNIVVQITSYPLLNIRIIEYLFKIMEVTLVSFQYGSNSLSIYPTTYIHDQT